MHFFFQENCGKSIIMCTTNKEILRNFSHKNLFPNDKYRFLEYSTHKVLLRTLFFTFNES